MQSYVLDGNGNPVAAGLHEAFTWKGEHLDDPRVCRQDVVQAPDGKHWFVSTVFLCLDHGHGKGDPILWETMVFPCDDAGEITTYMDLDMRRYSSVAAAESGHAEMLEKVRTDR